MAANMAALKTIQSNKCVQTMLIGLFAGATFNKAQSPATKATIQLYGNPSIETAIAVKITAS